MRRSDLRRYLDRRARKCHAHTVVALIEVNLRCGNPGCYGDWAESINPDARIGWIVCPVCDHGAPVAFEYGLTDKYVTASVARNQEQGVEQSHA